MVETSASRTAGDSEEKVEEREAWGWRGWGSDSEGCEVEVGFGARLRADMV